MIINGGSRSNWRFFAKHLMKAEGNERVEIKEIRGLAADDIKEAFREMDALASGTRCKNFFYHANINPRDDEVLTPKQWEQAVDMLEENLGLGGNSRFIVEHEKDGRTHRHVVWSRINLDSMTAVSDSQNYSAHEVTSRALEQAFGHEKVLGAHARDGKRPSRGVENWETFRGERSGIDPREVKSELSELWQRSDNGNAFVAALNAHGYILCKGDRRDFCVVDQAGDAHSLARRLDGVKAVEVRQRMRDIDRESLPSVSEATQFLNSAVKEAKNVAGDEVPGAAPMAGFSAEDEKIQEISSTSSFDNFAAEMLGVMRENHGDPVMPDGLNWLERSLTVLSLMRDKLLDWTKSVWQELMDGFIDDRRSGHETDDPGRER